MSLGIGGIATVDQLGDLLQVGHRANLVGTLRRALARQLAIGGSRSFISCGCGSNTACGFGPVRLRAVAAGGLGLADDRVRAVASLLLTALNASGSGRPEIIGFRRDGKNRRTAQSQHGGQTHGRRYARCAPRFLPHRNSLHANSRFFHNAYAWMLTPSPAPHVKGDASENRES